VIPWLDAVVTLGGLIIPPIFDFIRKKWIKAEQDTPERTMGSLAMNKPDVLPQYTEAMAKYLEARVRWFNRDVIGTPSRAIIDLRAAIRPVVIVVGLIHLSLASLAPDYVALGQDVRLFYEAVIASWFGSRLTRRET